MSGFMVNPDPGYKPTIGEALDSRHELDEQTMECFDAKITALERRVAFLESLLLATGDLSPRGSRPGPHCVWACRPSRRHPYVLRGHGNVPCTRL
jgi:hypothetical protein